MARMGPGNLSGMVGALTAAALMTVVGIVWALESAPPATQSPTHASYCPLVTGNGMELPTPGPTHNSSPNATQAYANGSVIFWASASGCTPPYTFTWSFGDGSNHLVVSGTYTNLHPYTFVHVYPGAGYYPGDLSTADSAGHSSITYFCIDASAWPDLSGSSGNPAPHCGP